MALVGPDYIHCTKSLQEGLANLKNEKKIFIKVHFDLYAGRLIKGIHSTTTEIVCVKDRGLHSQKIDTIIFFACLDGWVWVGLILHP